MFQLEKVIGHRGACGYAPENTLISMSKAHELGAKWVEFDVMLSGTGEPVIIHDFTLERTTNGSGEVGRCDLSFLSSLDCGSWFSPDFKGQKIPTLVELLTHAAALGLGVNIEIKPCYGFEKVTAIRTLEQVKSTWPSESPSPLISSFSKDVLDALYQQEATYPLGYIVDDWNELCLETIKEFNCVSLHIHHEILNPAIINQIKQSSCLVLAYTVNDPARALQLFDWGVDSVFSDYPDVVLSAIAKENNK